VLTLVGWCLVIKGLIRFCAPKTGVEDDGAGLRGAVLGVLGGWRHAVFCLLLCNP
jgi:hypothetical protein